MAASRGFLTLLPSSCLDACRAIPVPRGCVANVPYSTQTVSYFRQSIAWRKKGNSGSN
jgi:hypothetical protein